MDAHAYIIKIIKTELNDTPPYWMILSHLLIVQIYPFQLRMIKVNKQDYSGQREV